MDQALAPSVADHSEGNRVNEHFFNQLVTLSATHDVKTSEDIYASNGMKLVSKGTRISGHLYERMVAHKLFRPLEQNVEVADGIDPARIVAAAAGMLDSNPAIRVFAGWKSKLHSPVEVLASLRLTSPMQTMLSVYASKSADALAHMTQVALIALGMKHRLQCDQVSSSTLACASLFHDTGEIYIDPQILNKRGSLLPAEWKQLCAHPVIGQTVLGRMEGFAPEASVIIGEHHERLDGFGYPIGKKKVSPCGQILSVAETVASLINKRDLPLRHAEIALKIVNGEYAREMLDLIACARAEAGETDAAAARITASSNLDEQMHALFKKLAHILMVHDEVELALRSCSSLPRKLLEKFYQRFGAIQRAFSNTGLDSGMGAGNLLDLQDSGSALVRFEAQQAVNEIQWRLRELSRELALRCIKLPEKEAQPLLLMAAALAED